MDPAIRRQTIAEFDAVVDRVAAGLGRLGALLVPINFMLKAEEVAYILKHAGAQ